MNPDHLPIIRRLRSGLGAQVVCQAVQIIIRLAEVPLLLSFWGAQLYGEWLMFSAIPAYLSIGDGGFATAACRDMTMKSSAGDRQGALVVFQSTWLLLLVVSTFALVMASTAATLPLQKWMGFSVITSDEAGPVLLLLVLHVLVGFQGGLLNGGFWVSGKYPTGMALTAATQLLEFIGLGLAVVTGGGPVEAAAGYVGGRVIGSVIIWFGQRISCPWLKHGFAHASLSELKRLATPAFASLAFPLGNALNIQGMRMVIGLTIGPAAVALFTPLRTLSNLAVQPRTVINRLIEPELALAFGADNASLVQKIFLKSCQITFWSCLAAVFVVGIGAQWIFPVWTKGQLSIDWPVLILLLVSALFNSMWYTALMIPYATNRHGRIATYYIFIYGISALLIGYPLSKLFLLNGSALTLIILEIIMSYFIISHSLFLTNLKYSKFIKEVLSLKK